MPTILKMLATAIIVDSNIEAEQSSSPPGCPPPAKKMKQSLGSLLKQNTEYSELPVNLSPRDKIKHEIDAYLKEQNLDTEGNPLEWWRSHESTYPPPLMARISKKYLCVPATSTSSERVFSKGGLIVTPHRASLKPETAEMLIFLSSNL